MRYPYMKRLNSSLIKSAAFACCALLSACSSGDTKNEATHEAETEVPVEAVVADTHYEVSEDKSSLSDYYELDHIKEWYPERILPPPFDYNVDISEKTITELSFLRNEIFARNGYLFDDAVLRGYFQQFDWYQPIFDVPEFKITLNEEEQKFVDKVLAREKELARSRYVNQDGNDMINLTHVYNTVQFKKIDQSLERKLAKNNFAIVPGKHSQLFHVYDYNHYEYIPNFITTDIYLQVLHKHFSTILQKAEEDKLTPLLTKLLEELVTTSIEFEKHTGDKTMKDAARWSTTYLAVASHLLTGTAQITPGMESYYRSETGRIVGASGVGSTFLNDDLFQYAQFKPRGNYTKSPALERYFRCVKWLNSAPIYLDDDERFLSAIMIASFIKKSPENYKLFTRFNDAISLIAGDEDNLSLSNLITLLPDGWAGDPASLQDPQQLPNLRERLLRTEVNKITPKGEAASKPAILFTAGRYTFDAEILSRLIHVLQPEPKRPFPKALDVLATLGNAEAEKILLQELNEGQTWKSYPDSLQKLKKTFAKFKGWKDNLYNATMDAIRSLDHKEKDSPLFMRTSAWDRKNLVTSLAAWTELKHDMLLYSEQPRAAQAGEGGGPPPPQHISYVEPNVRFWEKALSWIDTQEAMLSKLDLLTDETRGINQELREIGNLLLTVSKKELANTAISKEEFEYLSWIGGRIEYLTFRIFGSDHLPEQEKDVALVADVYNYNGVFLEEAVGMVDEIYVVTEINGKPCLTRGAMFSYYEFTNDQPLNDEEWLDRVSTTHVERPMWVKDIMVETQPLETKGEYSF